MSHFAGMMRLVRLGVRRDRLRLGIWLLLIVGLIAVMPPAIDEIYSDPAARAQYVATMSDSMMGRLYGGILDGDSVGAVTMVESFSFVAVLVACMSAFLVIRHTRADEDRGAAGILHSTPLGRLAPLAAALVLAAGVNSVIVLASVVVFLPYEGYPVWSGLLYGGALFGVGMSFAAIAALLAQVASSARSAVMLASIGVGVAFTMRGVGDALAQLQDGRYESQWLSWLSPIGWGQQMYPLTRQEWWVFGVFGVATVVVAGLAIWLRLRRDIGAGVWMERTGAPHASRILKTHFGFAWHVHRGATIAWLASVAVLGGIYGSMVQEFKDMIASSEFMKQYIVALGGEGEAVQAFIHAMIAMTAVVITGYVVTGVLRMRREESSGRLESVFATATDRATWMMSHIAIIMSGMAAILIALGVVIAVSSGIVTGESVTGGRVAQYVAECLLFVAPLYVSLAMCVCVYSVMPRIVQWFAWIWFFFVMAISQLAALLKVPEWLQKASPFYHIDVDPGDPLMLATCGMMVLVSSTLILISAVVFRRRDVGR